MVALNSEMFNSGALGLVYFHLASLGNMRKLLDRLSVRSAQQTESGQNTPIH